VSLSTFSLIANYFITDDPSSVSVKIFPSATKINGRHHIGEFAFVGTLMKMDHLVNLNAQENRVLPELF
jgi:hypothetical protein